MQDRMPDAAAFTYARDISAGWTEQQLIDKGLMRPVTSAAAVETDERLRLLVERIERLEEEKKGISDDIKDVYAETKAVGYDTKMVRQIIRLRKMKPEDRKEMESVLDVYKAALGLA